MSVEPGVSIDAAHCALIAGLIRAQKPRSVLEFGWGAGKSAQAIADALCANKQDATHTIVDSWADWRGQRPAEALLEDAQFVETTEAAFIVACEETFDFILSDADHTHAHEWHTTVYVNLLKPGGILIYHDVCNYPNLAEIVAESDLQRLRYVVFNRNSLSYEACQRGLLVIFKPNE